MARTAFSLAGRLLLFPIRRFVRFATAMTGVPRDAMRPLLLGRTVHRAIELGLLSPATPADIRAVEARRVRSAFEAAFDGINRRVLRAALAELTRAGRGGAPGLERLRALARDFDRRLEAELARNVGSSLPTA